MSILGHLMPDFDCRLHVNFLRVLWRYVTSSTESWKVGCEEISYEKQ